MARLARVLGTPERRNRPLSGKRERLELVSLAGHNNDTETGLASQPLRIILTHLGLSPTSLEVRHG